MAKVYQDYVPPQQGQSWRITPRGDGTCAIEDVTQYIKEGTAFAAADANGMLQKEPYDPRGVADDIFAAMHGENLLDNSDFFHLISQRNDAGLLLPVSPAGGRCTVYDRWINEYTADGPYVEGGALHGALRQILEHVEPDLPMTLSVCVAGAVYTCTAAPGEHAQYIDANLAIGFIRDAASRTLSLYLCSISPQGFVPQWAKLEYGSFATRWRPKDYLQELTACRRCFEVIDLVWFASAMPGSTSTRFIAVNGGHYSPKRVVPTLTINGQAADFPIYSQSGGLLSQTGSFALTSDRGVGLVTLSGAIADRVVRSGPLVVSAEP